MVENAMNHFKACDIDGKRYGLFQGPGKARNKLRNPFPEFFAAGPRSEHFQKIGNTLSGGKEPGNVGKYLCSLCFSTPREKASKTLCFRFLKQIEI